MLLSIQQKYIMTALRELRCLRAEQLQTILQGHFDWPEPEAARRRMDAMLRQMCGGMGDVHSDGKFVWLGHVQPDARILEAVDVMLELAEGTGIPVVKTMMGISLMPTRHPLNMGMIGAHGNHCANKALAKSDLLIMVGTRAADRAIIQPDEIQRRMATIHIDVDPAEIGKNMQAAVPLVGDVKVILRQVLDLGVEAPDCGEWRAMLADFRKAELSRQFPSRPGFVFPGTAIRKLGAKLDDDAVVCADVGQNQIFTCKYLPQKHGRLLTSGGLGTMGYALPAGVGVKVALPDRQTVVVCGDGSFQMAMNELAAVKHSGMDLKIVLFRNNTLGLVHQIQSRAPYRGPFGVDLDGSPDFETIAAAYGIPCITVADDAELDFSIDRFLAEKGPCLMICQVHPDVATTD